MAIQIEKGNRNSNKGIITGNVIEATISMSLLRDSEQAILAEENVKMRSVRFSFKNHIALNYVKL